MVFLHSGNFNHQNNTPTGRLSGDLDSRPVFFSFFERESTIHRPRFSTGFHQISVIFPKKNRFDQNKLPGV
jgi:hypothetical protein